MDAREETIKDTVRIEALFAEIDGIARDWDGYEMGLPYSDEPHDRILAAIRQYTREVTEQGEKCRAALQKAVDLYGKPGGPWNVPDSAGSWLREAKEALGERADDAS